MEAVRGLVRSVHQTPLHFAIRFAALRRGNLNRFLYAVWFCLSNHGVYILAILHPKRDHRAILEQRSGNL